MCNDGTSYSFRNNHSSNNIFIFDCGISSIGRRDADADAEAGARLTCHLLLRLFKTNEIPQPSLYSVGK